MTPFSALLDGGFLFGQKVDPMELRENQKIIEQIIPAPLSSENDGSKDFDLFNLDGFVKSPETIIAARQ